MPGKFQVPTQYTNEPADINFEQPDWWPDLQSECPSNGIILLAPGLVFGNYVITTSNGTNFLIDYCDGSTPVEFPSGGSFTTPFVDSPLHYNNKYNLVKITPTSGTISGFDSTYIDSDVMGVCFGTTTITSGLNIFQDHKHIYEFSFKTPNDGNSFTDMTQMFQGCKLLAHVKNFNATSCLSMENTFQDCLSLSSIHLGNLSSVTNFSKTFYNCYAMKQCIIDDVSAATSFVQMFMYAKSIEKVILSGLNVSTSAYQMFSYCSSLKYVNLDTSNMDQMSYMFQGCINLETVDLDFSNLSTNSNNMFQNCSKLKNINISNATSIGNTSNFFVESNEMKRMPKFNTSICANGDYFFASCHNLTKIEEGELDTSNFTNMNYMFYECVNIKKIPALDCSGLTATPQRTFERTILTELKISKVVPSGTLYLPNISFSSIKYLEIDFSNNNSSTSVILNGYSTAKIINLVDYSIPQFSINTFNLLYLEIVAIAGYTKKDFILKITGEIRELKLPSDFEWCLDVSSCVLSANQINDIFNSLPVVSDSQTIDITSNPGAETCDINLATAKGWTVIYIPDGYGY